MRRRFWTRISPPPTPKVSLPLWAGQGLQTRLLPGRALAGRGRCHRAPAAGWKNRPASWPLRLPGLEAREWLGLALPCSGEAVLGELRPVLHRRRLCLSGGRHPLASCRLTRRGALTEARVPASPQHRQLLGLRRRSCPRLSAHSHSDRRCHRRTSSTTGRTHFRAQSRMQTAVLGLHLAPSRPAHIYDSSRRHQRPVRSAGRHLSVCRSWAQRAQAPAAAVLLASEQAVLPAGSCHSERSPSEQEATPCQETLRVRFCWPRERPARRLLSV